MVRFVRFDDGLSAVTTRRVRSRRVATRAGGGAPWLKRVRHEASIDGPLPPPPPPPRDPPSFSLISSSAPQLIQDPHNGGGDGRESTWASRRTARRIAASEADCKPSAGPASQPTAEEALASADPPEWLPSVLINPTLVRIAKQAREGVAHPAIAERTGAPRAPVVAAPRPREGFTMMSL